MKKTIRVNGTIFEKLLFSNLPICVVASIVVDAFNHWSSGIVLYIIFLGFLPLFAFLDIISYKILKKTVNVKIINNELYIDNFKVNANEIVEIEYCFGNYSRYSINTYKITYYIDRAIVIKKIIPKVEALFIKKENPSLKILKKHFPELINKIK